MVQWSLLMSLLLLLPVQTTLLLRGLSLLPILL